MAPNISRGLFARVAGVLKLSATPAAIVVTALKITAVVFIAVLSAADDCGGMDNTRSEGFTLTVAPATIDIAPGANGTVTITAVRKNNYDGPIALDGHVSGSTGADITSLGSIAAGANSGTLTISVQSGATIAARTLTVTGHPADLSTTFVNEVDVAVNVITPGSFTMTEANDLPASRLVFPGQSVHFFETITRNQFTQPVTLTATLSPAATGITTTITQPGTSTEGSVTLTVAANAPATLFRTAYQITISGSGGTAPTQTMTPQAFDVKLAWYALSPSPGEVFAVPGGSAGVTVTALRDPTNTASIALTGTSATNGITVTPGTISATAGSVQINVASSVPVGGPYAVVLHGNQVGTPEVTTNVTIAVTAPGSSYTLAPQSASINVALQATGTNTINIGRTNFTGGITVTGVGDDPNIAVVVTPPGATTGNSVSLAVTPNNRVSVGTHVISVSSSSSLVLPVTTSYDVVTSLPAGGAPVGIVLLVNGTPVLSSDVVNVGIGSTKALTAYLVDAAGNRVAPAAGFSITIVTTASSIANANQAAFDPIQLWRTATLSGAANGSTTLRAMYVNSATGALVFGVTPTVTVP